CGGSWTHGAGYLGPQYAGVRLHVGAKEPLPFVSPPAGVSREEQEAEFTLLGRLNRLAGIDYPDDPALRARIKAYELAFGMQTAVPETLNLDEEGAGTRALYSLDRDMTRPFGRLCLAARRLVERGVRFVQLFHGGGDEIGFHAVEDRHYVTDIHATVLHQLGLDPRRLEVPGRKRLEIDYGQPIRAIIA